MRTRRRFNRSPVARSLAPVIGNRSARQFVERLRSSFQRLTSCRNPTRSCTSRRRRTATSRSRIVFGTRLSHPVEPFTLHGKSGQLVGLADRKGLRSRPGMMISSATWHGACGVGQEWLSGRCAAAPGELLLLHLTGPGYAQALLNDKQRGSADCPASAAQHHQPQGARIAEYAERPEDPGLRAQSGDG